MKRLLSFIFALVVLMSAHTILAESMVTEPSEEVLLNLDFDVDDYTYEELLAIHKLVTDEIAEKQFQYAIEHGNRTITFAESEIVLYMKRSKKLSPVVTRILEDAPRNTYFVWSSSDPKIVKVSPEGYITAVNGGEAYVTCTAKDDSKIFGSILVTVAHPVNKLVLSQSEAQLFLGSKSKKSTVDLNVNIEPIDAYCQTVTWKSSNTAVATVDHKGHVEAISPGTARITAESNDEVFGDAEPKRVSCTITVIQSVTDVILSENEIALSKGQSKKLSATVLPANATKRTVKWTSSNPNVATVDSTGSVYAKANGTCEIICTALDGSEVYGTCKVSVSQLVTGIKLENGTSTIYLFAGGGKTIAKSITPSDATRKIVKWSTSDSQIATISARGFVKGIKEGKCTITCASTDGSGKKATITVVVESKYALKESGYAEWEKSYGTPWLSTEVHNTSNSKTVDGFTLQISAEDVYGNKLKYLGKEYIEEIINLTVKPGQKKYTEKIYLPQFSDAKRIITTIVKVHYTDGTTITYPPNEQFRWNYDY